MAIGDKDRKILWGRSGNKCALCRLDLVTKETPADREAVVGDEAHIAARSPGGPRYGQCSAAMVDSYENLILLCRVDHKRVDDQPLHYTTARLRQAKAQHEAWVRQTLNDSIEPIRLNFDSGEAVELRLMTTGDDVWDIVKAAHRFVFDDLDDGIAGADDLDLSATFLQNAKDWGDISTDVAERGMRAIREAKTALARDLAALRDRGFLVLGGLRPGLITGGVKPPEPFIDAYLIVLRADDDRIQREEKQ